MPCFTGGRDGSEMVPAPPSRRRLLAAGLGTGAALALGARTAHARVVSEDGGGEPEVPEGPQTPEGAATPRFSDVEQVGPGEVLRFLAGRHPRYPGANIDSLMAFSSADILETMDTDVMDSVQAARGYGAVQTLYALIAREILEALLAVYGGAAVVLALDAGHRG